MQPHQDLEEMLELLPSLAAQLSDAGDILYLNEAWRGFAESSTGVGQDGWTRLIHPEDRHLSLSNFRSAATTREEMNWECRLQDPHGAGGGSCYRYGRLNPLARVGKAGCSSGQIYTT